MDTVYRMLAELRRWKKAKTAAALPYSLPPPKFKLFDSLAAEVRLMVYRYLFTDLLTPEDRQMESRYDNDKSSIPLVMLIKRYTLYKRFWSSGNWMYADENFQLQFETARAMLHLNKQTRNEVATCLFECVTFYTQTYGVVRRFEKLLTPTAKSLIRHVKIRITYRTKKLCEALQQFDGLQDLILTECRRTSNEEASGSAWVPQHLHALRAIRKALPALTDAYHTEPDRYSNTEVKLTCLRRIGSQFTNFDIEEEYQKWMAAKRGKRGRSE